MADLPGGRPIGCATRATPKIQLLNRAGASRMTAVLGLAIAMTACAPIEPPRYVDPLAKLHNVPASSVPRDVPVKLQEPIGLVVSENGELFLDYAAAGEKGLRSMVLVNETASKDLDPKYVINQVVGLLKRRYPRIELVDDLASARKTGKKGTILVDIQTAIGQYTGQTTTVQLTLILFDAVQTPISRVTGTGQGVLGYPAFDARVKQASDAALQQLDTKLAQVLR